MIQINRRHDTRGPHLWECNMLKKMLVVIGFPLALILLSMALVGSPRGDVAAANPHPGKVVRDGVPPPSEPVDVLIRWLQGEGKPGKRAKAARALAGADPTDEVVAALENATTDPDRQVREAAA